MIQRKFKKDSSWELIHKKAYTKREYMAGKSLELKPTHPRYPKQKRMPI